LNAQENFLLALEGGGTRSQAAILDFEGRSLQISESADVNTNFTSHQAAEQAVLSAVSGALQQAGISGNCITHFASALVGPRFGPELLGKILPHASYYYYGERDVVFARAGIYRPHGVAVVAATGATSWGVRCDDGRQVALGGWGSLLGDEGSAYAAGLLGLRTAVRAFEGREAAPTRLVERICQHLGLTMETFHYGLVRLAYQKPLSRAEIAGLACVVTRLAGEGDALALRIVAKVSNDLAALALHAARRLFSPEERFEVAAAGGLLNAGEMILNPLRAGLAQEFPQARVVVGTQAPAVALGRLALYDADAHLRWAYRLGGIMLIDTYFEKIRARLDEIAADTQPIQQAASVCAEALAKGGVLHVFDSGHMVSSELINRAGGLVALSQLAFSLSVSNPVKARGDRPAQAGNALYFGYIEHIFETNQLRPGDVLFVGSVSGKTANVVELALQARAHGLTVIALTALAYSSKLASEHPSGKRLYEAADLVLDNHAPYGDALLEVEGLDYPICPASGIGAATILWAVVAGIVEEMLRRGLKPTVFPSVNRPDGKMLVSQVEAEARRKGF